MELFELVDRHCNIRLLRTSCNFRECGRKPSKEMLIYQIDMHTAKKRDIISLYLCPEHYQEMEKALESVIGRFRAGKIYKIQQEDRSIKVVTY
jgi:hypothetical protein